MFLNALSNVTAFDNSIRPPDQDPSLLVDVQDLDLLDRLRNVGHAALARMTSPKMRPRSEKVHSTFHILPYVDSAHLK